MLLAPHSSVWFAVEIDAEDATVELGEASNIQDNSRIYLEAGETMRIGRRVTVGHNVRMHACEIEDEAIIRAVIMIAESMGLDVVAEGIESPDQRDVLGSLGVERAQGYLVSPALAANDFITFVGG